MIPARFGSIERRTGPGGQKRGRNRAARLPGCCTFRADGLGGELCELTVGHGDALSPVLVTLAWLAALLLVFVSLAVRALPWA